MALPAFGFDPAPADLYRDLPDTAPAPDAPSIETHPHPV